MVSGPLVWLWNLGALLSFLWPLGGFVSSRTRNRRYRQYEENRDAEDYNNNYNNHNNNNYNNNNGYDEAAEGDRNDGNYYNNNNNNNDGGGSSWWQWSSSNNYDNREEGGGSADADEAPWWWLSSNREGGGGEEARGEGRGTLIFVYLWLLALFFALTIYGNYAFKNSARLSREHYGLVLVLISFANFTLLCCVLIAGLGGIGHGEGGNRDLEEYGWYGQPSVLVFTTSLLMFIYSIVFALWIRCSANKEVDHKGQGMYYNEHDGITPHPTNQPRGSGRPSMNYSNNPRRPSSSGHHDDYIYP